MSHMSNTIRNKFLALRYFTEIMSDCNLATVYELVGPEFVLAVPAHRTHYRGPDGLKELVVMMHACFPDFNVQPVEMVGMGDSVVTRWRCSGTHLGAAILTEDGEVPATGQHFEIGGISWQRFQEGKLVESYANEDIHGMFVQLGIIPSGLTMTNPEQNLATMHRFFDELVSKGNYGNLDEILTSDVTIETTGEFHPLVGWNEFQDWTKKLRIAFPDLRFTVDRQIAEFNKVATRWYLSGTHKGEYLGVSPSGKRIKEFGESIFLFEQGKIKSINQQLNQIGLIRQLQAKTVESE
jgi:steroid delta-isomerase-like uncharacterized protein